MKLKMTAAVKMKEADKDAYFEQIYQGGGVWGEMGTVSAHSVNGVEESEIKFELEATHPANAAMVLREGLSLVGLEMIWVTADIPS